MANSRAVPIHTVDEDDEEEDSHVFCDKQILAVVEGKGLGIATDCGGVKRLDAENRHLYYQRTILRTTSLRRTEKLRITESSTLRDSIIRYRGFTRALAVV